MNNNPGTADERGAKRVGARDPLHFHPLMITQLPHSKGHGPAPKPMAMTPQQPGGSSNLSRFAGCTTKADRGRNRPPSRRPRSPADRRGRAAGNARRRPLPSLASPRQTRGRRPRSLGGQREARHQPAAEHRAEQRQIGRRPGRRERRIGVDQIGGRALQRVEPFGEAAMHRLPSGPAADLGQDRTHFGEQLARRLAAVAAELAADQIVRLDAVGAFVDRRDARVAIDVAPRRSPRCSPSRHAPGCRSRRSRRRDRCTTP